MTATTDPQLDALLATIRERPGDDGPRLVYADWLEEAGECERGEFIRVQVRLAAFGKCPKECDYLHGHHHGFNKHNRWQGECRRCAWDYDTTGLRRRERELLSIGGRIFDWIGDWTWRVVPGMPAIQHTGNGKCVIYHNRLEDSRLSVTFHRGFIASVSGITCEQWCGGPCGRCRGSGLLVQVSGLRTLCHICKGEGRTPALGPLIVRAAVLDEDGVRLAGIAPRHSSSSAEWYWTNVGDPIIDHTVGEWVIPRELFQLLEGGRVNAEFRHYYPTDTAAYLALSRAAQVHAGARVLGLSRQVARKPV